MRYKKKIQEQIDKLEILADQLRSEDDWELREKIEEEFNHKKYLLDLNLKVN